MTYCTYCGAKLPPPSFIARRTPSGIIHACDDKKKKPFPAYCVACGEPVLPNVRHVCNAHQLRDFWKR